ncbi:hypothetical protein [Saccharopolyspora sp. NPDC002376]
MHEPLHRFHLDIPSDALSAVAQAVARLQGVPRATTTRSTSCLVEGELPAAHVHELQQKLPGLTYGEGVLEAWFARYTPSPRQASGPTTTRSTESSTCSA